MRNKRNKEHLQNVLAMAYLYFLGLSTRNVAKALSFLHIVKRSHMYQSGSGSRHISQLKLSSKRRKISEFVVDETMIQVGS